MASAFNPDVQLSIVWALSLSDVVRVRRVSRQWCDAVTRWALEWATRDLRFSANGDVHLLNGTGRGPIDPVVRMLLRGCHNPFGILGWQPPRISLWPTGSVLGDLCGALFGPPAASECPRAWRHMASRGTVVVYPADGSDQLLTHQGYHIGAHPPRWGSYVLVAPGADVSTEKDVVIVSDRADIVEMCEPSIECESRWAAIPRPPSRAIQAHDQAELRRYGHRTRFHSPQSRHDRVETCLSDAVLPNAVHVQVCDGDVSTKEPLPRHLVTLFVGPHAVIRHMFLVRTPLLTQVTLLNNQMDQMPLFDNLPNLTYIDISGMSNVRVLRTFLFDCPALTEVNMSGMTNVRHVHPRLFSNLPSLTYVHMSGMTNVGLEDADWYDEIEDETKHRIKWDRATGKTTQTAEQQRQMELHREVNLSYLFDSLPTLQYVDLSGMTHVPRLHDDMFKSVPALNTLLLRGMETVVQLPKFPSSITALDVSGMRNCQTLQPSLFAHMTNLRSLDLTPCSAEMDTFFRMHERCEVASMLLGSRITVLCHLETNERTVIVECGASEMDTYLQQHRIFMNYMQLVAQRTLPATSGESRDYEDHGDHEEYMFEDDEQDET